MTAQVEKMNPNQKTKSMKSKSLYNIRFKEQNLSKINLNRHTPTIKSTESTLSNTDGNKNEFSINLNSNKGNSI